ncbi:YciI family protein [Jiangella rhizosphaerae]|uniref:YciI family protein n=1 Tax=Jiangella rhizosphaerae TaxID=2293569 RepID=A0A418KNW2_9ACTN|nr:YciI family protein [Jiangella rhizosphaerae]RIQ20923.1 YciI family protein [Jiangella rhizosphaerae]
MKYLILIYRDPHTSGPGHDAHAALARDLAGGGELILAETLADPSQTKRVHAGEVVDGPVPDAGAQPAAFYLVECETLDCAVAHAARAPEAAVGRVEVRPVLCPGGLEM